MSYARATYGGQLATAGVWFVALSIVVATAGGLGPAAGTPDHLRVLVSGLVLVASFVATRRLAQADVGPPDTTTAERLEAVVDLVGVGFWDWDLRTQQIHYSPSCSTMLGFGPTEIDSNLSAWGKLVHPDDLPRLRRELDAMLEGETDLYEAELRIKDASGRWRWILDRGRIVERIGGVPARAIGVHIDISHEKAGADAPVRVMPRADTSGRGKILIVDDNAEMRLVMRAMAENRGFDVVAVSGGPEALGVLKQDLDIGLVVTDLEMPSMTGAELVRTMRVQEITLPVVMVSGQDPSDADLDQAALHFLPKPFTAAAFADSLDAARQRRS